MVDIIVCDSRGIIFQGREGLNNFKQELAELTNIRNINGSLSRAVEDADVFIGVSAADVLTPGMIKKMKKKPIIFAMANPEPEIQPGLAKECGVEIIATRRSDYPNQVNNVLAFPGIFRGALDSKAEEINIEMKLSAAKAIAKIAEKDLSKDYIIPKPFDKRILPAVAESVARSAVETGYAPGDIDLKFIKRKAEKIIRNTGTG